MPRNDTITRWECGGQHVAEPECEECVERVYVAVDALLSDEAIQAAVGASGGLLARVRATWERGLRAAIAALSEERP